MPTDPYLNLTPKPKPGKEPIEVTSFQEGAENPATVEPRLDDSQEPAKDSPHEASPKK